MKDYALSLSVNGHRIGCKVHNLGPIVISQRQKYHRRQCIFTFARKFTKLQIANIEDLTRVIISYDLLFLKGIFDIQYCQNKYYLCLKAPIISACLSSERDIIKSLSLQILE